MKYTLKSLKKETGNFTKNEPLHIYLLRDFVESRNLFLRF